MSKQTKSVYLVLYENAETGEEYEQYFCRTSERRAKIAMSSNLRRMGILIPYYDCKIVFTTSPYDYLTMCQDALQNNLNYDLTNKSNRLRAEYYLANFKHALSMYKYSL